MKISCPNCKCVRELPHEDKFSCNFECSCGHVFSADDESVLEEYSEIDLPLPPAVGGYPVEKLIGLGGMGKVCRGQHKTLPVPVAIKLLRRELMEQESAREKFLATSQLCAKLDSPYIVKVYECGLDEGAPYLIMEYLEGGTALDLLEKNGPLSPELCAKIALEVTLGLEKAEEAGLVHRDLKPDNIMFASDFSVRIMDLGLAFLREDKDKGESRIKRLPSGTAEEKNAPPPVIGTAHYMPPEQILNPGNCDTRSDLYALGITMYQLLTGSIPFDDPDHEKVRQMQLNPPPLPPSVLRKDLPQDLEKIILTAMEKAPCRRYQDARSMAADLDAFLHSRVLPSSFRTVAAREKTPHLSLHAALPHWQKKMIIFAEERFSPAFRAKHKELLDYLSTTPQLHLLRLLAELILVLLLAIASAFFCP